MLGANLPWIQYGGDFGANAWHPDGGITARGGCARLDEALSRLTTCGVTAIRWFMLCDGRAGIRFDGDGLPLGLDDYVFADIDAAVRMAVAHRVSILFTLIDFTWCGPRETIAGVQTGGRSDVLFDAGSRAALIERVLAPILDRYGREPSIMGWDIINEPEWATFGHGSWNPSASIPRLEMREFVRAAVDRVHQLTNHPATVGLARGASLDLIDGLGLDFYQVHWYDKLEGLDALESHVTRLADRRPVLLGEFPTRGTRSAMGGILTMARQAGYFGAFFWSALAEDGASDGPSARTSLDAWVRSNADAVEDERPSLG